MATGTRKRYNLAEGTLGAALTDVATTIDFGTDPGFATLVAGEYISLTIDNEEIVHLTAFTAAATTGTIERAQEGTTAVAHSVGDAWVHGPTKQDFEVDELDGYGTLAVEDVGVATYTVLADDTGKVKRFTVDCTVTLPDGLVVGTVVDLMAYSANGITVEDSSATPIGTVAQYDTIKCLVVEADIWIVVSGTIT